METTFWSQSKPTVLLVDDDLAMVRLLTKWLESSGYRVCGVSDGRAALAAMETECPQFLVTDWEMPYVSGMELCAWVRSHDLPSYVYTIILTARSSSDDMIQGLESGADDFLRKPVNKDELLARMRAGLRVLELERRLSLLAKRDSLTGLYTQRAFFEALNKEWARAQRYRFPLSCVMLDIDYFKRVNDSFGHAVGDEVIRRVARILETHTRSSDLVSRYGGEEFCILLPETDEQQAVRWAERVRRALARTQIALGDKTVEVTASFGAAQRLEETVSSEELVDMADQALLVSKRTGRDRVTAYQTMNDSTKVTPADARPPSFRGLCARDVMTTLVAGLNQHERVGRAVEYFLELRLNSAPVVDDDGRLVGVLTDKDAMSILLWPRWWETTIAEVMRTGVVTYDEEAPAFSIYEFLCRVAIRSVIVIKDGRPTGIISRASLLRWFTNALIAHGEAGEWEGVPQWRETPEDLVRQLGATASALTEHANRLQIDIAKQAADLAPRIVGSVSQMQELVNDLLGYSRFVGDQSPSHDSDLPGAAAGQECGLQALLQSAAEESVC
jgi:diguanylate cyclase (GGDEF)-like protein